MVIGIDNGLSGGIAVLDRAGEILATFVMPKTKGPRGAGEDANIVDARAFSKIVGDHPDCIDIAIERPAGAKDVNAVQSMADSFSTCRTVILCRNRNLHAFTAFAWQRSFWPSPPRPKKGEPALAKFDTKAAAAMAARILWPNRSFLATGRSTTWHDGIVDACLIAEHQRRKIYEPDISTPQLLEFDNAGQLRPRGTTQPTLF